ncbi:MAG TPA: dihydrofolate reductase family protein [Streptosporangiaceae bacterium]|nr:dihydrofolate reductase family protein [Streptosporangiaceae bacterium]
MRKLTVTASVTLDGVMQAPGRPDEDTRGGFTHGGWALPYDDRAKAEAMGRGMAQAGAMLFGRRTYEDFYRVWPRRAGNPFTGFLDGVTKYVTSRTLTEPLPWQNSRLLRGDAAETVAVLKQQPGPDLAVIGSGELITSLARHGLVDEYVLLIHPLVLGTGRRLFPGGTPPVHLRLAGSEATGSGVIIATYHGPPPARPRPPAGDVLPNVLPAETSRGA